MHRIIILSFFLPFYLSLAFGSGSTGGGNTVRCQKPNGLHADLLDYYEVRTLNPDLKLHLSLGATQETELDKVKIALDRLAILDPKRAHDYFADAEGFVKNRKWTEGYLPDVNDHGYVSLPVNCEIKQLAIQYQETSPARLTLQTDYWNDLPPDDKAGLMLHEAIYGDAMRKGHKNSVNARYFNALVSSDAFSSMTPADYKNLVYSLGLEENPSAVPPHAVMNPVILPGAIVSQPYQASITPYVTHPFDETLSFSKVNGASWIAVSPNGEVRGIPSVSDEGENTFTVLVMEPHNLSITIQVKIMVPLTKPKFMVSSIDLGVQEVSHNWTLDLHKFLVGPSRTVSRITFTASGLPSWMKLDSQTGILSGMPKLADVGNYNGIRISVVDESSESGDLNVPAFGQVRNIDAKPHWVQNHIILEDIKAEEPVLLKLSQYVVNDGATAINYSLVSMDPPPWVSIDPSSGNLIGTSEESGTFHINVALNFQFNGAMTSDLTTFEIKVLPVVQPPYWVSNPIMLNAIGGVGTLFSFSLSSFAMDHSGKPLVFSLVSGPSWLILSPAGVLRGRANQTGKYFLQLKVSDGTLDAVTTAILQILASPDQIDSLAKRPITCNYELWGKWIPVNFRWSDVESDAAEKYYLLVGLLNVPYSFGYPRFSPRTLIDYSEDGLKVVDQEGYYTNELSIDFKTGRGLARQWGSEGNGQQFDNQREIRDCSIAKPN